MAVDLVTIAELRARLAEIVKRVGERGSPLYVTQRGQARAVLLGADAYRGLIDQLEYLDDSLEALQAKERREKAHERTRRWEEVKRARSRRARVPR